MTTSTDPRAALKRVPFLVQAVRAVRRLYADVFAQRVFTTIYRENQWDDADSRSGSGSTLVATARLRVALPDILREHGIRTMLDVPCGDFHWMRTVELGRVEYTGADIVPDVIAANAARWAQPGRRFVVLDASRDPIPRADLILCRDLFIHLSSARIHRVLEAFRASGATWLAASTYTNCPTNQDVRTGSYRAVNMQAAPFHFPAPTLLLPEDDLTGHTAKSLGLWRLPLGAPELSLASGTGRGP